MILTKALRIKLEQHLPYKLKANDCIRCYLKTQPSFKQLVLFVKTHSDCKRRVIPQNMHYNRYVRDYWVSYPNGSHSHCVQLWRRCYRQVYYHYEGKL